MQLHHVYLVRVDRRAAAIEAQDDGYGDGELGSRALCNYEHFYAGVDSLLTFRGVNLGSGDYGDGVLLECGRK